VSSEVSSSGDKCFAKRSLCRCYVVARIMKFRLELDPGPGSGYERSCEANGGFG
jgi:hypothetical protein